MSEKVAVARTSAIAAGDDDCQPAKKLTLIGFVDGVIGVDDVGGRIHSSLDFGVTLITRG